MYSKMSLLRDKKERKEKSIYVQMSKIWEYIPYFICEGGWD